MIPVLPGIGWVLADIFSAIVFWGADREGRKWDRHR
jgi:hypothetical protein